MAHVAEYTLPVGGRCGGHNHTAMAVNGIGRWGDAQVRILLIMLVYMEKLY